MKFTATLLVWLALVAGLLQAVICIIYLSSSGWAIPLVVVFILLPIVPLVLMHEVTRWRRMSPVVPASAALLSIAVSGGFYWELFARMR